MRICTLVSSYELSDSPFRDLDGYPDPSPWGPAHEWQTCLLDKATAVRTVAQLARRGFDVFVNLCDGAWEEDLAGVEVTIELERRGCAYTGANPRFFEPTRSAIKLICPDVGVDTPPYVFAETPEDIERAAQALRFPLLVKHPNGYGSIGLTPASRVLDAPALATQTAATIDAYGGALIEEFITGREFTVLVAEPGAGERTPRTYAPIEIRFPPGESFKHFDLKWHTFRSMVSRPVEDADLDRRLRHLAAAIFEGIEGTGYARCDVRMDEGGRLHLIDLNPNPGIFNPPHDPTSADRILGFDPAGHAGFLAHILDAAQRRRDARRRRWTVRHHPETGYGMVATQDLAAGERVVIREERPMRLVSAQHVEETWPAWRKKVFRQAAGPISDGVYSIWSEDPDEWYCTNHSCDPSLVFRGLDLVARRPIRRGEPLTLDYATIGGLQLEAFECKCGAAECRGTVRGDDYLAPWVEERYGDGMLDWVRMERRRRGLRQD